MRVQVVGCTYRHASVDVRERLAFSPQQAADALVAWRQRFPDTEAVLLSTCNRVELYSAAEDAARAPTREEIARFMAEFHGLRCEEVLDDLFERHGADAVRHLFMVAAALDSMVVGEPQILNQVKQAYSLACERDAAGPLTHEIFQASLRAARRVAAETAINQRRVSIPSVAIGDFARQIFEQFDDKHVVVLGAGEMGEETVRYLLDEGARDVTVINRSRQRAEELAARWHGRAVPWEQLDQELIAADLVVSTTGASQPVVTLQRYRQIEPHRYQRPLFVLDLAIPRDFEPAIGDCLGVYLYSIDDLKEACAENLRQRDQELPAALQIIEEETQRFMKELNHRATGPVITRLKQSWYAIKEDELTRLLRRLPHLDERDRQEINLTLERLVNKLLHPPLDSLKRESRHGSPHGLMDALRRLFHLHDDT